jgi:glycosyltransferase involved in cell wall biosynthesis
MKRRRVLFVVPGFPIERDEPGLAAVSDLVERLSASNDVRVIALRHPPERRSYSLAGTQVTSLAYGRTSGALGRARVLAGGVRAVVHAHRDSRVDVVHALWADEAGAVAVAAGKLVRRPTVVSIMGGELVGLPDIGYGAALGRGGRVTAGVALRGAAAITVGSSYLHAKAAGHVDARRLTVAPLGVDTAVFSPDSATGERTGACCVLFVGSLEPVKDPLLMLRTFATVAATRDDARLVVAGDGALRGELDRAAQRLGVHDRVLFRGHVPRSEMPALYRSASVMLVTSRHEAQSMAAVEAAACGVPVVGTRVGVLADLGEAVLTAAADEKDLASVLGRVLDEPALAARMGAAARAIAVRDYDIDTTAARVERLYDDLLSAPR